MEPQQKSTRQPSGKEKRLTKQRDYWKGKYDDLDRVLRDYPRFVRTFREMQTIQEHAYKINDLRTQVYEQTLLIEALNQKIAQLQSKS